MGYFDDDIESMLEIYLLETNQLIGQLSAILLQSEKNGAFTREEINSVFRIMHTIKSSSGMMGLNGLSSMAHKLEDLFAFFRDEQENSERAGDTALFDVLFAVSDYIERETGHMARADYYPEDTKEIEAEIQLYMDQICNRGAVQKITQEKNESTILSRPGVIVKITFEENCRMENVRAFMVINQIKNLCDVCESEPADPQKHPESAAAIQKEGILIRFESSKITEVLKLLNNGLFVNNCEIIKDNRRASVEVQEVQKDNVEMEYLNVRLDRLDNLQNLTGELMILLSAMNSELGKRGLSDLEEHFGHQTNRIMDELEQTVIHMRMVPVGRIIPKFKRIMRDICKSQNKEADLEVSGETVEADKNIVDHVSEAAMHVMRNALDHGIEPPDVREKAGKPRCGKIKFQIRSLGGELSVEISDDGRGIDAEKLRKKAREKGLFTRPEEEYSMQDVYKLMLIPGMSTMEKATEYSGRGVGLDVAKSIMDDTGGHLHITSEDGKGTKFSMHLPLTLATMECIRLRAGSYLFVLPYRQVLRFFEAGKEADSIREQNEEEVLVYKDRIVPIVDLRKYYGLENKRLETDILIFVRCAEKEICLRVDEVIAHEKVVLKPVPALFGKQFRKRTGINACSIMGDGNICMALDVEMLLKRGRE